jgi:hypothetical protein
MGAAGKSKPDEWNYVFLAELNPRPDVYWPVHSVARDNGLGIFFVGTTPRPIQDRLSELGQGRTPGQLECVFLVPEFQADGVRKSALARVREDGAEGSRIAYPALARGDEQSALTTGYIGTASQGCLALSSALDDRLRALEEANLLQTVEAAMLASADELAKRLGLHAAALCDSPEGRSGETADLPSMSARLAELERYALANRPEFRERISRVYGRGPFSEFCKSRAFFRCQICERLGACCTIQNLADVYQHIVSLTPRRPLYFDAR